MCFTLLPEKPLSNQWRLASNGLQSPWNTSLWKERKTPVPIGISHTEELHLTSGFCNLSGYTWQKKRSRRWHAPVMSSTTVVKEEVFICGFGSHCFNTTPSFHFTFLSSTESCSSVCFFSKRLHEKLKLWQSIGGVRRMQLYGSPTVFWRAHCCHHTSDILGIALLEKTSAVSWGCQQWSCCLSHFLSAKSTTSVSVLVIQQWQATATEPGAQVQNKHRQEKIYLQT